MPVLQNHLVNKLFPRSGFTPGPRLRDGDKKMSETQFLLSQSSQNVQSNHVER